MTNASVTTVNEASDAFLSHLGFKRRSKGTVAQYAPVLRALNTRVGGRDVDKVSTRDLEAFIAQWIDDFEIRNGREPSDSALKNTVVTLKSFFKYLHDYGLRTGLNPTLAIDPPEVTQKQNDWLRTDEDEALLRAPISPDEAIIIWFIRWTGLRISEALSLTVADVDLLEGNIYVRKSKTPRGIRAVPIVPELRPRITTWLGVLQGRGLYSERGAFFPTSTHRPWAAQYAAKLVRRVAHRAGLRMDAKGIARVSPHTLRRTFGSHLLNRGARLEVVSKLLGHSSTEITERAYAELLDETVRREMLSVLAGVT